MSKLNSLLNLRLKSKTSKLNTLAKRAQSGKLSSFSGVFKISELNKKEKGEILKILEKFQISEEFDLKKDHEELIQISSEVKAITNQAVILHGERIKKAQALLKNYKEGAFSAWLIFTYGNRQTPYNFLQYFELYSSLPNHLKDKLNLMPRQAIYSLASRSGNQEEKEKIINDYKGETKIELLNVIRKIFPLDKNDKRSFNTAGQSIIFLNKLKELVKSPSFKPTLKQQAVIHKLLNEIFEKMQKI